MCKMQINPHILIDTFMDSFYILPVLGSLGVII